MIRGLLIAALLLASGPAWADSCQWGSWDAEMAQIQHEGWRYTVLSPSERDLVLKTYEHQSGEKIVASRAYEERKWAPGLPTSFSMVFTDDAGCIQFRLNYATARELKKFLDPGI